MDKHLARARASSEIEWSSRALIRGIVALEDAHAFHQAHQLEEVLFEAIQIRREILELPRETGVPPALEYRADASEHDVPF